MNYRHIYHAGNFADVFKHVILTICLESFHKKNEPFFVLDTHAGIGKYSLNDEKSLRTNEAASGIREFIKKPGKLPKKYLDVLAKINCCEVGELPQKLKIYGGSPIIIKYFIRPQDRVILAELNREDFAQLRRHFAGNKKFTLLNEDGFKLTASKLPPLEKRGLVIIDPAFEKDQKIISDDYKKIIFSLSEAKKRFANGVYVVWHPIINGEEKLLERFYQEVGELRFEKITHKVFEVKGDGVGKMNACGVFVINAPDGLEEGLKRFMHMS
jgi:23S rRNA (adenine2030-N6)-methyltransferase